MGVLFEKTSYSPSRLWSVHIWHAVVQQYEFVHPCFALDCQIEAAFDQFKCYDTATGSINTKSFLFKHHAQHLNID